MAKPCFLFSTSSPISQPYRDEDTPCSAAVTPTHADYLTPEGTLASNPLVTHHTIDAPSSGVYTQLDEESTQISGYPLQEKFLLSGPSTCQRHRQFWVVLSLAIGVLLILAVGVGVGIPSSLHDPSNFNSSSGSGIAIDSDIHIRIGRGTGDSNLTDTPTNTTFCITVKCPCPKNCHHCSVGGGLSCCC